MKDLSRLLLTMFAKATLPIGESKKNFVFLEMNNIFRKMKNIINKRLRKLRLFGLNSQSYFLLFYYPFIVKICV